MKKTISMKAAASLLMAVTMTACSSSTAAGSADSSSKSNTGKTQEIIVATSPDYPPFESLTNSNELEGFDVDMTTWLFDWMNENGYSYTLKWSQMSFDTIISSIQTDQVDLGISGFTYDKDRKVLFSDSYYDSAEVALVTDSSDITSTDDLKGKKIGAQLGTTGEDCANDIEGADVTAQEDMGILVESLKAGGLDAVIMDQPVAENYAEAGGYKVLDTHLLDEEMYIIAKEGNTELMDAVNKALAAYKKSDDFDSNVQKWLS